MTNFIFQNPNATQAGNFSDNSFNILAILFEKPEFWGVVPFAPYRVFFNTTDGGPNVLSEMIRSIDEAIIARNTPFNTTGIKIQTKDFQQYYQHLRLKMVIFFNFDINIS